MLNSYSRSETNISDSFNYNINAVSGTIRKSHPKSKITKVKLNDTLLDKVNPKYTITTYTTREGYNGRDFTTSSDTDYSVVILQVMLCGDSECLVEFVRQEDFETMENVPT